MAFQEQGFPRAGGRKVGSTDRIKMRSRLRPGASQSQPVAQHRGRVSMEQQPTRTNVIWFIPHEMQQWLFSFTV